MRYLISALIIIAGAITLTIGRSIAQSAGLTLGALPTMALVGPWFVLLYWLWDRWKRSDVEHRQDLMKKLKALIDDPNTPSERREWAIDRLARMQSPQD